MTFFRIFVALIGGSMLLVASQPVATITSSAAFELQGHEVNVGGVPSWPVAAGDVVATRSGSATIQLREGTRVTLLEDSRVRIGSTGSDGLKIDLLAGRLRVGSIPSKQVSIYVDGRPVRAFSGSILASSNLSHPVSAGNPRSTGNAGTRPLIDPPPPVSSR